MADNKKTDKLVAPTSREVAIAMAEDLFGVYINGTYFGVMNDEFNPETSVSWSDDAMADFIGAISEGGKAEDSNKDKPKANNIRDALQIAGVRSGKGFGLAAKKVFDKASYWSWSANITLIDWEGTGLVWDRWEMLKNLALPASTSSALLGGALALGIEAISGDGIGNFVKGIKSNPVGSGIAVAIAATATAMQDEEAMAGAMARSVVRAPSPVHLRIGRYAQTQGSSPATTMKMVIDSFGATFSKEMTPNGPVEATFNITFSSVEPLTAESMPVGGARCKVIEGAQ